MLQNANFLAKIGADTAENERKFAEILQAEYLSKCWNGIDILCWNSVDMAFISLIYQMNIGIQMNVYEIQVSAIIFFKT